MKPFLSKLTSSPLKLSMPLIVILLLVVAVVFLFYFKTRIAGNIGGMYNKDVVGIDLTTIEDIKNMRSEMIELAVNNVKYIRNNYNLKLEDIAKVLWKRRGNSDQWTMAIVTEDIDNYKAGDIVWSGDPGLLCSGNIPYCNLAKRYLALLKKNPKNPVPLNSIFYKDDVLKINLETDDFNGPTWIVSLGNVKTQDGIWLKRSEGLAYPIKDRRILLLTFGIYDYTGVLYDFDQDFQNTLEKQFGLKN